MNPVRKVAPYVIKQDEDFTVSFTLPTGGLCLTGSGTPTPCRAQRKPGFAMCEACEKEYEFNIPLEEKP